MSSLIQKCAICLEVVNRKSKDTAVPASCKHIFHRCCIETWSTMSNTCPLCKERFKAIKMVGTRLKIKCKDTNLVIEEENPPMISEDPCVICGGGDNAELLLLCDGIGCDKPHHTYCMGLSSVPEGDWFCPDCKLEVEDELYHPGFEEQKTSSINVSDNDSYLDQDYIPPNKRSDAQVSRTSTLRRSRRVKNHLPEVANETEDTEETNVMNLLEFDEENNNTGNANNQRLPSPPLRSKRRSRKRRRMTESRLTPPRTTSYCRNRDKLSPARPLLSFINSLEETPQTFARIFNDQIYESVSLDEKNAYYQVSDPLEERMLVSTPSYNMPAKGRHLDFLLEDRLKCTFHERELGEHKLRSFFNL